MDTMYKIYGFGVVISRHGKLLRSSDRIGMLVPDFSWNARQQTT